MNPVHKFDSSCKFLLLNNRGLWWRLTFDVNRGLIGGILKKGDFSEIWLRSQGLSRKGSLKLMVLNRSFTTLHLKL